MRFRPKFMTPNTLFIEINTLYFYKLVNIKNLVIGYIEKQDFL